MARDAAAHMSHIAAHPLTWPDGWPRSSSRRDAQFRGFARAHKPKRELTIGDAIRRVLYELAHLGVSQDDCIVSTNIRPRLDGFPRSDGPAPIDPGAAVYWQTLAGDRRVIAIDHYSRVADNLAAIAATLEAMRVIRRHGGAQILERAFTGFTALPPPAARSCWQVLEIDTAVADLRGDYGRALIEHRFRALAKLYHPDAGGDAARFAELTAARDEALRHV